MSESPSQDTGPTQAEATPQATPETPQPAPQAAPIPDYVFVDEIAQKSLDLTKTEKRG